MPTFREIARVSKQGGEIPDVSSGELLPNAWMVHELALTKARQQNMPFRYNNQDGFIWHGYQADLFRELWPALSTESRSGPMTAGEGAEKKIAAFLKRTENLRCLEVGSRNTVPPVPSRWWVRAEFNGQDSASPRQIVLTDRERHLTASEAGETREAAPVTASYQCTWERCSASFTSLQARSRHIFAVHRTAENWIEEALGMVPVPASPAMIWECLKDVLSYPASASHFVCTIADMASEVGSPVVNVAKPPRKQPVYALRNRLGEMPDGDYITPICREPGCGRDFASAWIRNEHEKRFHPESPYRVWKCDVEGCEPDILPFFDKSALSMHMRRSHPMAHSAYLRHMSTSEDRARAALADLPSVRITGHAVITRDTGTPSGDPEPPARVAPERPRATAAPPGDPAPLAPKRPRAMAPAPDPSVAVAEEARRAFESLIEEHARLAGAAPSADMERQLHELREERARLEDQIRELREENGKLKERVLRLTAMTQAFLSGT